MELPWLEDRHVLLDTNVLINHTKNEGALTPFFALVKDHNCPLVITDAIYFEFIRAARTRAELTELHVFIEPFIALPTTKQDIEVAAELSMFCSAKEKSHGTRMSFVDNLLGSQLKKYGEKIVLATSDIDDFPLEMYTRLHVEAYDLGKNVVMIAFIEYNQDKAKACRDTFERKTT